MEKDNRANRYSPATRARAVRMGSELTFWIRTELHRNGLGTWAAREFLDQLPSDIAKVTACCMLENKAAAGLLAKLGFFQVGPSFKRFSFANGHAVPFMCFEFSLLLRTARAF